MMPSERAASPSQRRLQQFDGSRRAGVQFLLRHVHHDGSVPQAPGRVTIYRVPWALAVGGESAAAHRVLDWIEREGLGDDGEFHGGIERDRAANHTFNTYPETCLAYGAHLLRRFDIARSAMGFARRFQDPVTGGVFMDREMLGDDGPQLLFLTCQYGMSAAMTGDVEPAIRAAIWLENLWSNQPKVPERMFTVWTRNDGLVTTVPEGEDSRHYVNESQEERQFHYNGGIAAAFLGQLYLVTGNSRWLDLAREFQEFSMESTPRQFETRQVCKSAWGATQLAFATGEDRYLQWLERMGEWFVSIQESDGHWTNSPYIDPDPPVEAQIEVTAEFVIHMDALVSALAAASTGRAVQPS